MTLESEEESDNKDTRCMWETLKKG